MYFDSALKNAFLVSNEDGIMMRFTEQGQGIYVHNVKDNNDMLRNPPNAYDNIVPVMLNHDFMSIVETALSSYTKREVAQAC